MKYNCKHCNKEFNNRPSRNQVYCSIKCQQTEMFLTRYKEWIINNHNPQVQNPRGFIKRAIIERDTYKCNDCGISKWNGKTLSLEVEHINGNWADNTSQNVCLLCPNCHSQTPTYKAKNRGNGRPR